MPHTITKDDYIRLSREGGGICVACGAVQSSGVEPDASNYECSGCKETQLYGVEQALIMDLLTLNDQDDEDDEEDEDEEELDEDEEFDDDDDDLDEDEEELDEEELSTLYRP